MISQKLIDHTNIVRAIGCILYKAYTPSVSMRDSIRSITLCSHTSIVLYPGSDDHVCIHTFIHEGLLSSSLKKQQDGKVSSNNVVLGIDYKLTINMLMKQLYIAV